MVFEFCPTRQVRPGIYSLQAIPITVERFLVLFVQDSSASSLPSKTALTWPDPLSIRPICVHFILFLLNMSLAFSTEDFDSIMQKPIPMLKVEYISRG